MTNFTSHVEDAGMDPKSIPLTFFRKASGSIAGPSDDIVKPAHVRFLDYEVEIGLVIGREIPVGTEISEANLADYIAGLVVTNDVSARDVQLPKTQFYEVEVVSDVHSGRSGAGAAGRRRTQTLRRPTPAATGQRRTPPECDRRRRHDLSACCRRCRRWPGFSVWTAGDLVLTGTPVGTALSAPPKPIEIIGSLLPPAVKWKAFFSRQAKNPKYLQDGDIVEAAVATDDGAIDLGSQRNVVRYA